MGLLMNILQFTDRIMGIYLCGRKTAMPKQFLDRIQIRPMIHQVGGKTVPEYVWAFFIKRTGLPQCLIDQCPGILGV